MSLTLESKGTYIDSLHSRRMCFSCDQNLKNILKLLIFSISNDSRMENWQEFSFRHLTTVVIINIAKVGVKHQPINQSYMLIVEDHTVKCITAIKI